MQGREIAEELRTLASASDAIRMGAGHTRAVFERLMRSMLRLLALFTLCPLAACTSFDAGPPPVPRSEIVAEPVSIPANIRPLTEDQRAMLDG